MSEANDRIKDERTEEIDEGKPICALVSFLPPEVAIALALLLCFTTLLHTLVRVAVRCRSPLIDRLLL